jgi:hypothetical protein
MREMTCVCSGMTGLGRANRTRDDHQRDNKSRRQVDRPLRQPSMSRKT